MINFFLFFSLSNADWMEVTLGRVQWISTSQDYPFRWANAPCSMKSPASSNPAKSSQLWDLQVKFRPFVNVAID